MVKHIVMWKLKNEVEGKSKEENAKEMKIVLEDLINKIEVLRSIEVGININEVNEYDVVLYSEVDSMEDLDIYQKHPAHVEAGKFIKTVVEARACVDYEV